jgi:hypothetical protein
MHRLRFLLTTTKEIHMSEQSADLLFGPIAMWITATSSTRMAVPSAYESIDDAETVAGGFSSDPDNPHHGKFIIALRMCTFWTLFVRYKHIFPPEALFAYYTGIAMDIHIPALDRPSLCAVYTASSRTAPETIRINDVLNDDPADMPRAVLETLWSEHLNGSHSRTTPQHEDAGLHQLLVKCLINVSTTRYIIKSIIDGLSATPPNRVIVNIMKAFFTGSYQHAHSIAAPAVRIAVYNVSEDTLVGIIRRCRPKEAYAIVTEFVAAATSHNDGLSYILRGDPVYRSYHNNATTVADLSLRPRLFDLIKSAGSVERLGKVADESDIACRKYTGIGSDPALERSEYGRIFFSITTRPAETVKLTTTSPPLQRLFWDLAHILDTKPLIDTATIDAATHNIDTLSLYAALRLQPQTLRIYRGILIRMAMSEYDIDIIASSFVNLDHFTAVKQLGTAVKEKLSPGGLAKLKVYVHYIVQRAMIVCQQIHVRRVIHPVTTNRSLPFVIVCNNCVSIRSHCYDVAPARKKSKKRNTSTAIDIYRKVIVCGACRSEDIGFVDTR